MLQLHVCSEKLVLREWCTLKLKAAWLENFFFPHVCEENVKCFSWNFYPFGCDISILGRWGGGGHLLVLKKIYRPHVIFKFLGSPCAYFYPLPIMFMMVTMISLMHFEDVVESASVVWPWTSSFTYKYSRHSLRLVAETSLDLVWTSSTIKRYCL